MERVIVAEAVPVNLDEIRSLILDGKYFFYTHALTEAKKDGVTPEDVVYTILTGEVIEVYSDRKRALIFAMLPHRIPLHVVCDYSQASVLLIPTVYIPDNRSWINFRVRRKEKHT